MNTRYRIAVILTCFNRREKTLACLDAVLGQAGLDDTELDYFVTDDASADGTAAALHQKLPQATLLAGSGALFWNGGMRLAWSAALPGAYDFYLWLNDDTFLYPATLRRMLDLHAAQRAGGAGPGIVVGSTDNGSGETSYGGERQRSAWRPMTLSRIVPRGAVQQCDTFNGNCVLISRGAADVLGNLDSAFVHAMGDTDYGLRARRAGIPMWVLPGYAGHCVNDGASSGGFGDRSLPFLQRWRLAMAPKGLPWRPWLVLCRRHAGVLWPLYWSWPYLKIIATAWRPPTR